MERKMIDALDRLDAAKRRAAALGALARLMGGGDPSDAAALAPLIEEAADALAADLEAAVEGVSA